MDALERLVHLEEQLERRERVARIPLIRLRDRQNPFEYLDCAQFKEQYHMYKETAMYITTLIKADLTKPIRRGIQLPPEIQFLITLRMYVTGSFYLKIGDLNNVSQPSVCRIVKRISIAIAQLRPMFITFPNHQQAKVIRDQFYQIGYFPGVVGCIDGCQVRIKSPGGNDAELFRNRNGYFAINVQAICDANLNFTNIVARWYGSAHDSRMFDDSKISIDIEEGRSPGQLLGDSGYPCHSYLLTPLLNPQTPGELRYNHAHRTTWNTIDRTFGIWKRRFPCLNDLRTKVPLTLTIIVATAILHNITRSRDDIIGFDDFEQIQHDDVCGSMPDTISGRATRKTIIATHFD